MNIGVQGQKYEGKTTLAIELAFRIKDRANTYKIVAFDPKWAIRNPLIIAHDKVRCVEWAEGMDDFRRILLSDSEMAVYRPRLSMDENSEEVMWSEFTDFSEAINLENHLRNPPDKPVILFVDEAYFLQAGKSVHPAMANAIRLATKGKLYIILAVHGPRELAPMIRRQLDEMYIFRQTDVADLDYVQERCGPEAAIIVSKLPHHHVLVYYSARRMYEVWANPEAWKVEIGRPAEAGN